jgi:hydrogenase maturation protein HypF
MACAWLKAALGEVPEEFLAPADRGAWAVLAKAVAAGVNAPLCSSAGRLFDAVAAIAGLRGRAAYEGQPAVELEGEAAKAMDPVDGAMPAAWPFEIADVEGGPAGGDAALEAVGAGGLFEVRFAPAVAAIAEAVAGGAAVPEVAARFHATVVATIADGAERARESTGLGVVGLSGGTFQNAIVLERSVEALEERGFDVRLNNRVSPNDGGIALGQAQVAAADSDTVDVLALWHTGRGMGPPL